MSAAAESIINYITVGIDLAAAFIIAVSTALALIGYIKINLLSKKGAEDSDTIRFRLAGGLLLALDFQVGSDLLKIVLVPTLNDLLILSVVVVLRILLSWSLSKEANRRSEDLLKK
ncbi:MAG: DUF1622 domain-containing protein [Nitrososphaera sp.]|jgi:uncharacterized membrane protein